MESTIGFVTEILKSKGIRPSYQRIKVLEYLTAVQGHPTVDDIYCSLAPLIPSLSKVTVYNTLHILLEAGLVRTVEIEDTQMRYDVTLNDHGHFLCEACGTIYNFPIEINPASLAGLSQFQIKQKNVYFKGTCPKCLKP